jgi:hypothetical protein
VSGWDASLACARRSASRNIAEYKGYTVDIRLQEFRKVESGKGMIFVPFTSRQGQGLLKQMHEDVMQ